MDVTIFSAMIGTVYTAIHFYRDRVYGDTLIFRSTDHVVLFYQKPLDDSGCAVDSIGNLEDLVGVPLLRAEETVDAHRRDDTGQFYTIQTFCTERGTVTLRWYGSERPRNRFIR